MAIVLSSRRSPVSLAVHRTWQILALAAGFSSLSASAWAQISPCDLNGDGAVNVADVQLAVNMSVGATACSANILGAGVCNVVVVQRVVNAALGQPCVVGSGHSATLAWVASPSPGVSGYNVYRGTASGGPYSLLNTTPVSATNYADGTVQAGLKYYYVVRAVGAGSSLSVTSNEISAVVPTP